MQSTSQSQSVRLDSLAGVAADEYNADIYLYSGPISEVGLAALMRAILDGVERANCLLILSTNGGSISASYKIARFIHRKYSRLLLCVPGFCRSAGTLIALGAHKLLLDEYSEIGPLTGASVKLPGQVRPQLGASARLGIMVEIALDAIAKMTQRLRQISDDTLRPDIALSLAISTTTNMLQPYFAQLNFSEVADELDAAEHALAYGKRLADHARNANFDVVEKLVKEFPSHQFVIDYAEVLALFISTGKPTASLSELFASLGDQVYVDQERPLVKRMGRAMVEHGETIRPGEAKQQRRVRSGKK
jgi:membrane-bound ClpP family serine protease